MTQALSALATTDRLFFERDDAALDRARAEQIVAEALSGCDDGELFLEYRENEHISLEDGRIRNAGFDSGSGFGLRGDLGRGDRVCSCRRDVRGGIAPGGGDGVRGAAGP